VLTFLLGGARSGKSDLAVRVAEQLEAGGRSVVFVATAEARDAEMTDRIARHREERPVAWATAEAPLDLLEPLRQEPTSSVLLVDCLSLWVSNLMERGDSAARIQAAAEETAAAAAARPGPVIAVSNEVGMGLVPTTPLGRAYRDVLGRVNATWSRAADRAYLVVAGRALRLEDASGLAGELAAPGDGEGPVLR
jgi:adenosylcobinamide kinase/adenosylcobinamide-phosphate guanylyltransferase